MLPIQEYPAEWESIWKSWLPIHKGMLICDTEKYDRNLHWMKAELFDLDPRPTFDELREASRWIWKNEPDVGWECHLKLILAFIAKVRAPKIKAEEIKAKRDREEAERKQLAEDKKNGVGVFSGNFEERIRIARLGVFKPIDEVFNQKEVNDGEVEGSGS